jgi:hypothetical protein
MKEIESLLKQLNFVHARTQGFWKQIVDSPLGEEAAYWRMPFGESGRAHIGWQFMHLAATYHKFAYYADKTYSLDEKFISDFGHGSTPDANRRISLDQISQSLDTEFNKFLNAYSVFPEQDLDYKPIPEIDRTHRENIYLMLWHEASHLGQSQITWNAFRAMK